MQSYVFYRGHGIKLVSFEDYPELILITGNKFPILPENYIKLQPFASFILESVQLKVVRDSNDLILKPHGLDRSVVCVII